MSAPQALVQQAAFRDADAWCEAVNDWNLDFRQLDAGPLDARIERVIAPDLAIQRVSLSRRFHQQGIAPHGVVTFGIPLGKTPVHWFGQDGGRGQFMNFNHRGGFDAVTEQDFQALTVSLSASALEEALQSLDPDARGDTLENGSPFIDCRNQETPELVALLNALMHQLARATPPAGVLNELKAQLRHLLARTILEGTSRAQAVDQAQRQHAVDRAVELIRHAPDMPTIEAVHQHCHVSYRTLHRGFRERFGITPKQYLLRARLAAAQQALLRAQPGQTVTDIASDIGFWHLGRFAQAYQRMFGEKPSDTLAKRR